MENYFSPSTQGFYPPALRADYEAASSWPADAVAISFETEQKIRKAIEENNIISIDNKGVVFTKKEQDQGELASIARGRRDSFLSSCDYMAMPDYPITSAVKIDLSKYRQLLRDVTEQPGFPYKIEWPIKPNFVK